jgi:hypothetical protein
VSEGEVVQEAPLVGTGSPPAPRPAKPRSLYERRFTVVYGLLGLAVLASIGGIVLAAGSSITGGKTVAWSTWRPSGGGLGAAKEIADHIAGRYRLPNGNQLVDVIAKRPSVSAPSLGTLTLAYVAVQTKGNANPPPVSISSSNSVMYSLCGLGTSCAISSGKPSIARGTLVRREILELALYTFKYVGGIDHVLAFMPPAPGVTKQRLVYLQRSDVADQLRAPITQTLGSKVPLPSTIPAREVHAIDAITETRVYSVSLAQTQNGDAVLVLSPLQA